MVAKAELTRQTPVVLIEEGNLPYFSIRISSKGVEIRPVEKPSPLKHTQEKKPIDEKFRQAYLGAAAALFDNNLPSPEDRSSVVEDKLNLLGQVTLRLLAAHQGEAQLRVYVELTQKDLAQLAALRGRKPAEWERCQELLAHELQGTVDGFKEGQYQKRGKKAQARQYHGKG